MEGHFEENTTPSDKLEVINKAFRLILPVLARYLGDALQECDKNGWWRKFVLNKLNENTIKNLPKEGSYEKCIKSLDISACLNIIEVNWKDIFIHKMKKRQRTWTHELLDIRNEDAHYTTETLTANNDENIVRALDTMILFMSPINHEIASKIEEIKRKFGEKLINRILDGRSEPKPQSKKPKNNNEKLGEIGSKRIISKKLSLNLDRSNSAYSSINARVPQWSFNINNSYFSNDFYIILEDQDDKKLYCFYFKKGTIKNPESIFNQRNDERRKNASIIIIPINDKNFTNSWQGKEFQFINYKILEMSYQ